MTRKYIESAYRTMNAHLPDNSIVSKVGIYESSGILCPGILSATHTETWDESGVMVSTESPTLCWQTDKQLTLKQLRKIVDIWTELMRDDSV